VRIRTGIKLGGIALMITAGAVLGTAGPANAGSETIYASSMQTAVGVNWPVPAGVGSYDGSSYTMMLTKGIIYKDVTFGLPYQLLTLRAKTFQYGPCGHPAHAMMFIDGTKVLDAYPSQSTRWLGYSNNGKALKFVAGSVHRVSVVFDNDAYQNAVCDVNLDVASIDRDSDTRSFKV
jgi:hypothetical protein